MNLYIGISCYLLQQMRLIHAIAESGFNIVIPPEDMEKYQPLKKYFKADFLYGYSGDVDITKWLCIDHVEPMTSIGDLKRPIIFPHSITKYCRLLWQARRKTPFSFAGLVTEKRQELLEDWIRRNLGRPAYKFPEQNGAGNTGKQKFLDRLGLADHTSRKKIGSLLLWSNNRGRTFPIKSWDEEYFKVLSNSKFVLCPSGDCVWSYRFFEAVLCGAIPIIEQNCQAYADFRFFTMKDKVEDIVYRAEDARYNYELCIERITVPENLLTEELSKIIGSMN